MFMFFSRTRLFYDEKTPVIVEISDEGARKNVMESSETGQLH